MDMILIGKFIAQLRKEHGLTQEQLGERIGVTNKTISRWETGAYLPPADALLFMSGLFGVSVNELLSGKRLTDEQYKKAAEENLTQAIKSSSFSLKDKTLFYRKKWLREHAAIMVFIGACILGLFAAGIVLKDAWINGAAVFLLVLSHMLRYNSMMAYIEKRAYDGTGK